MTQDLFKLSAYHYELPPELIAQYPCNPRDHSRLLLVDKSTGNLSEIPFYELQDLLQKGDRLICNNTKVMKARLLGKRVTGGQAEIMLSRRFHNGTWEALVRPGKKLHSGQWVIFGDDLACEIIEQGEEGLRTIRFEARGDLHCLIEKYGQIPLPQYMKRKPGSGDERSYQTVYASEEGAVAAPTAGLHFSNSLLASLDEKGVQRSFVTLHVGLGTFLPVVVEDIRNHRMHQEFASVAEETAQELNCPPTGKRICVGTTSCRTLESAADEQGIIHPGDYETSIFIYPGYRFKYVSSLLTNFHLPGSTLLMLVSAFAGYELTMEAYRKAVKDKFRFYSYGDAMLIV